MKEQADFSTTVCGIPCGVVIDTYHHQPPFNGPASLCDSDVDFYGYTEMEWHLIDRKGYSAGWLENKMSDDDKQDLETEIIENSNC